MQLEYNRKKLIIVEKTDTCSGNLFFLVTLMISIARKVRNADFFILLLIRLKQRSKYPEPLPQKKAFGWIRADLRKGSF